MIYDLPVVLSDAEKISKAFALLNTKGEISVKTDEFFIYVQFIKEQTPDYVSKEFSQKMKRLDFYWVGPHWQFLTV